MLRERSLALFAGACAAFALAGCGGGGGGTSTSSTSTANASVTAADDTLSVPWSAATPLAVTGNDHGSAGTLALKSVSAPAHGQAHIDGGQLVYTPATGYFGPDTLTYTVSAGGASATATVHLDVKASLAVSGTVTDGPIANAKVVLTLGKQTQSVTADAQGHYSATLQSDDPTAFVTVDATGIGAQAFVKLRTLAGSFGALAAASSQGKLDSSVQRSLDVTHISTALAVLATQTNGGSVPASDAELSNAVSRMDLTTWEDMAAVIKTVIDGGVALPGGKADTLALVSDSSAYATFLKTLDLQQSADAFGATRDGVVQAMGGAAPTLFKSGADQTVVLYATEVSPDAAYLVQMTAAGQATVTSSTSHATATVARSPELLTLAFSAQNPVDSYQSYDTITDPSTGQPVSVGFWVKTTSLALRQSASVDNVIVVTATKVRTYIDGPLAGQTVADPTSGDSSVFHAVDYAHRLSVQASEFAAGTHWAGFVPASSSLSFSTTQPLQDVFNLSANLAATALHDPTSYTFSIADDVLTVAGGFTRRDYLRLATNTSSGLDAWLAIDRDTDGNPTTVDYVGVIGITTPFNWTASDAAHVWQLYSSAEDTWTYRLNQDMGLSAEWDYWVLGASDVSTTMLAWQFGSDQSISITQPTAETPQLETQVHNWLPLKRVGSSVCMLQTLSYVDNQTQVPSIYYRRVGCIADQGPTTP